MIGRRFVAGEAKRLLASGLASVASHSSFLIGELLFRELSETVIVVGNAPHNRPGFLMGHLVGNRASFLCTKAPLCRVQGELSEWHVYKS